MAKVNDVKAYWKELAQKNGIKEETLTPFLEAFDKDESFRKTFTDNFKPLPDYSHDLDQVRDRTAKETDAKYQEWYQEEQRKYAVYLDAEAKIKKYQEKYGELDNAEVKNVVTQTGLTEADVRRLMQETLMPRDNAYMDLLEVREQHLGTFKKPLDTKAFEQAWKDHPEWGNSMKVAYKSFVEPDMEKIREAEFNDRLQKKYDEGLRDGFSRRSLPSDSASKTFSPMFDRKEDIAKMTERDQESHSRQAFFDGLRDQKPA